MDSKEQLRRREAIAEDRVNYETQSAEKKSSAELNKAFVELYLDRIARIGHDYNGDWHKMLKETYWDAGFDSARKDNGVMYHARKKLEQVWPEIEQHITGSLKSGATLAVEVLIDLAQNGKESIRLKAATELLNKAGFAETQKFEIKEVEDLSDEELQKQIQERIAQQGLKIVQVASDG